MIEIVHYGDAGDFYVEHSSEDNDEDKNMKEQFEALFMGWA